MIYLTWTNRRTQLTNSFQARCHHCTTHCLLHVHTKNPLHLTTKTRLDSTIPLSTLQCYQHSGSNAARYTAGFFGSHCSREWPESYKAIFRSDPCWLGSVLLTSHSYIAGDGQVQFYAKESTRFDTRSGITIQHQGADLFVCVLMFCDKHFFFSWLRCLSQHPVRYTTADTNMSQYRPSKIST